MSKRFAILALTGLMGFTLGLTAPPAVGGAIQTRAAVSNGLSPIVVDSHNPAGPMDFFDPFVGALAMADDGRGTSAKAQGIVEPDKSLRLKAFASAVNGEGASAIVFFSDDFTTRALSGFQGSGFLALIVDISGTIDGKGVGTGEVHFQINNLTFAGAGDCDATLEQSGNASCVAFVPIRFNEDNHYLFDFSLLAIAGNSVSETTADFFQSATLPRIELLDQDKDFLRDITVTTDSGFQIPGVAAVPEPGTILLIAAGLAALHAGKRRRRGQAPSRR